MATPAQQKQFSAIFSMTRYHLSEFSDSAHDSGEVQGEKETKKSGGGCTSRI